MWFSVNKYIFLKKTYFHKGPLPLFTTANPQDAVVKGQQIQLTDDDDGCLADGKG